MIEIAAIGGCIALLPLLIAYGIFGTRWFHRRWHGTGQYRFDCDWCMREWFDSVGSA